MSFNQTPVYSTSSYQILEDLPLALTQNGVSAHTDTAITLVLTCSMASASCMQRRFI